MLNFELRLNKKMHGLASVQGPMTSNEDHLGLSDVSD